MMFSTYVTQKPSCKGKFFVVNADALVLLIDNTRYLHHFFCELGVSGSIGKTLSSLLVLELATLQVCSLK
jgi:hypothetical protein